MTRTTFDTMLKSASMFSTGSDVARQNGEQTKHMSNTSIANNPYSNSTDMSAYIFTPVNANSSGVSGSGLYHSSASGDQYSMPISTACFNPMASLVSPGDMSSPDFDMGNWDPALTQGSKGMLQDEIRTGNTISSVMDLPQSSYPSSSFYQKRHGQLTPPDDFSPKAQAGGDGDGMQADTNTDGRHGSGSKDRSTGAATGSSRRRSTKANNKSAEASASTPKRSRKSRRATKSDSVSDTPIENTKRERFLERNRVAASKCRQKKKEWTNGLEDDERQQKALNTYLRQCVAQMREELLFLKGECLRHSDCECTAIRKHMASTIPMMQPPSQALYNDMAVFSDNKNSPSMSSMYESPRSDEMGKDSRQSSLTDSLSVDDDMKDLLEANLVQDVLE